jgi:hypothetical protein
VLNGPTGYYCCVIARSNPIAVKNLETEDEYKSGSFGHQRRSTPENWQEFGQFSENRAHVETFDRKWAGFWLQERIPKKSGKESH